MRILIVPSQVKGELMDRVGKVMLCRRPSMNIPDKISSLCTASSCLFARDHQLILLPNFAHFKLSFICQYLDILNKEALVS